MTIMDVLFFVFIGYLVGYVHSLFRVRKIISDIAEESGIDLDEKPEPVKSKVRKLEVQQINDMLYLYERDTNDFICQANTIEDLAKLAQKYKNINFATVIHDKKVFMFIEGNSKEYAG